MIQSIGVVAIGRNEGERLRSCLVSARRDCPTVVYVDSGSTDGSVELARSLGVHIVELDLTRPFTAARARNEGFARLCEIEPGIDAVQFVDGDCQIVDGWIEAATTLLDADAKAAIACGRRRERFPQASVYNLLCDMEWNTPIGIAKACGGDALVRVTAFRQAGGYNPTVIAGEEPEMCVRLRQIGWTIHRLDAEMTLHDAAITHFTQWWKRTIRSGYAYAMGYAMHGMPPENFRRQEVRSIERWATAPILLALCSEILLLAVAPRWFFCGFSPLLLYSLLAARVALKRRQRHLNGESATQSVIYGIFLVMGKIPQWIGIRRFRSAARRGEAVALIEYKGPTNTHAGNRRG